MPSKCQMALVAAGKWSVRNPPPALTGLATNIQLEKAISRAATVDFAQMACQWRRLGPGRVLSRCARHVGNRSCAHRPPALLVLLYSLALAAPTILAVKCARETPLLHAEKGEVRLTVDAGSNMRKEEEEEEAGGRRQGCDRAFAWVKIQSAEVQNAGPEPLTSPGRAPRFDSSTTSRSPGAAGTPSASVTLMGPLR